MQDVEQVFERCAALTAVALSQAHPRRRSDAALYLAHVEGAAPLRRLADTLGRPLSSVHRAVRRVEAMREDPLLDHVFDSLADAARAHVSDQDHSGDPMAAQPLSETSPEAEDLLARALAALEAPGAFLMAAAGAERAGVFTAAREAGRPSLLLPTPLAAEMAARDWLRLASRTRVSARYVISETGRASLARRRAEAEAAAFGVAQAAAQAAAPAGAPEGGDGAPDAAAPGRAESPLAWLARRKGPDGAPFLRPEEVAAGERLRAAFEQAGADSAAAPDWRVVLAPRARAEEAAGRDGARERVREALEALGPGLAEIAWGACCLGEGLEAIERRMGWSARSGKVVLKIALQRLALHANAPPHPACGSMLHRSTSAPR